MLGEDVQYQESHAHPQYEEWVYSWRRERVCGAKKRCAVPGESCTSAVREEDVQSEERVCSARRMCAVQGESHPGLRVSFAKRFS